MDYLTQFNDTFIELVEDLIRVFPNDGDFRMYKMAVQTATVMNKKFVRKVFNERVTTPYGDKILAKDEGFFLSNDYQDMKDEFSQAEKLIEKLKECWSKLTLAQRDIIWKYLHILILLDRKIDA